MLQLLRSFNKGDLITVSSVAVVSTLIGVIHGWKEVATTLLWASGVIFFLSALVYCFCRFMLKMPYPGQSPTFLDVVRVLIILSAASGLVKGLVWVQFLQ